jgi:hypothetical protein
MSDPAISREEERALVSELAEIAVEAVAPEELALFEETTEDYFRDPDATLRADGRDEAVGFGLDLALLTPYILAVATPVVHLLATLIQDSIKEEVKPSIAQVVRRLLRREAAPSTEIPPLTDAQRRQVRVTAYDRARNLGLDEGRANVLADAVVGGLALG